jgi:hypothetical protein
MKNALIVLLLSAILFYSCSDSTGPDSGQSVEDTKSVFQEMDNSLSNFLNEGIYNLLFSMPDLTTIFVSNNSLQKYTGSTDLSNNYIIKKLFKTQDNNPFILIVLFSQLHGTFSYADSSWTYTETPTDALVFEYDFLDELNNVEKHAQIKLFNFSTTPSELAMSIEIRLDGDLKNWINLTVEGTDLLGVTQDPVVTSVACSGGGTVQGTSYLFSLNMTDSNIEINMGITDQTQAVIVIEGTGLLSMDSRMDTSLSNITSITITYGNLQIVIDDPSAQEGDVGDVLFNSNKVADLVVVDNELKVVFINGEEYLFYELMPLTFNMLDFLEN